MTAPDSGRTIHAKNSMHAIVPSQHRRRAESSLRNAGLHKPILIEPGKGRQQWSKWRPVPKSTRGDLNDSVLPDRKRFD
jgi:hypothetical protein